MVHLLNKRFLPVLLGYVINLVLENSPELLVLYALDLMNSSSWHSGLEASYQPVPLFASLADRLGYAWITTYKELNDVLPEIRNVVVLCLVDQFAHFKSYLVVPKSLELNVLRFFAINLHILEVTGSRVLTLHQCDQSL
jgi:hypothetical protein